MPEDAIQSRVFPFVSYGSSMCFLQTLQTLSDTVIQEEFTWHPMEACVPLLDRYRYACFTHPEHSLEGSRDPGPGMNPKVLSLAIG